MKKIALLSILLVSLVFAGCSTQMNSGPAMDTPLTMEETEMMKEAGSEELPVSSSTEIEDIEAELDGTVIMEEDFSDL